MIHPHEHLAHNVRKQLSRISGVIASAVRAQADPPPTPEEVRPVVEAELTATMGNYLPPNAVDDAVHERVAERVWAAPPPFPHACDGKPELLHYLRGLTDLLAPVDEYCIDARVTVKIGAVRFVAQSWNEADDPPLLVAVAIPLSDTGVKSLMRSLRRVRKQARRRVF